MPNSPSTDQMHVVHQVAARYWQQPVEDVTDQLGAIQVLKFSGGKVAGLLPENKNFPATFFKVYFYDRGFRFESTGLQAAAAMPPVEGVRVPSVIAILPEYKAILLKKREWEDTSSPWKRLWVNKLGIDWFRVGTWLRAFHDTQTTNVRNDYFLRKKYEKFESHLAALKHLFTQDQVDKMNRIYESAKEYFEKNESEWVISHGDFGLDNIKKSGDTLEIIDFEDCQLAPREFDILNCLTRLEYMGRFPHLASTYATISRRFLEGYRKSMESSPGYRFLCLLIRLDMLETYDRRKKNNSSNILMKSIYGFSAKKCLHTLII